MCQRAVTYLYLRAGLLFTLGRFLLQFISICRLIIQSEMSKPLLSCVTKSVPADFIRNQVLTLRLLLISVHMNDRKEQNSQSYVYSLRDPEATANYLLRSVYIFVNFPTHENQTSTSKGSCQTKSNHQQPYYARYHASHRIVSHDRCRISSPPSCFRPDHPLIRRLA